LPRGRRAWLSESPSRSWTSAGAVPGEGFGEAREPQSSIHGRPAGGAGPERGGVWSHWSRRTLFAGDGPKAANSAADEEADVLERVRKISIEHLDADPAKVTKTARFVEDLGADSLDTVELTMVFEEEFNVQIPDDALKHLRTVGDAVKLILRLLHSPAATAP
jgi:acyl carrier protein